MERIDPITYDVISPDRLILFVQLGKEFAFDIDSLSQHVKISGRYENPLNRLELPGEVRTRIDEWLRLSEIPVTFVLDENRQMSLRIDTNDDIGTLIVSLIQRYSDPASALDQDIYIQDGSLYQYHLTDQIKTIMTRESLTVRTRPFSSETRRSSAIGDLHEYCVSKHIDWLTDIIESDYITFICNYGDRTEKFNIYRDDTIGDIIHIFHHVTRSLRSIGEFDIIIALDDEDENLYAYPLTTRIGDIVQQPIYEVYLESVLVDGLEYLHPTTSEIRYRLIQEWATQYQLPYLSEFLPAQYRIDTTMPDVDEDITVLDYIIRGYTVYRLYPIIGLYDVMIEDILTEQSDNLFKMNPLTHIPRPDEHHRYRVRTAFTPSDVNTTSEEYRREYILRIAQILHIQWILNMYNY